MSYKIEMYMPIDLPPVVVRDTMLEVLPKLEEAAPPYDALSLNVALRDLGVASDGTLTMPIEARVQSRPDRWECGLEISAQHEGKFFPTFQGVVSVTPSAPSACELWLQGRYDPPLGKAGALLDATLLRGAAERSLKTFLEWLAKELSTRAEEAEKRHSDQARGRHAGT